MILESTFDIGECVWVRNNKDRPIPVTVGRVSVEVTDSPGVKGEEDWHNYKPQSGRREQYMCNETGIGSGCVYYAENNGEEPSIFANRYECAQAIRRYNIAKEEYDECSK